MKMSDFISFVFHGLTGASQAQLMAYIALAGLSVAALALWVALTVAKGGK